MSASPPRATPPSWSRVELAAVYAGDPVQGDRFVSEFGPVLWHDILRLCPRAIRERGDYAVKDWSRDRLQDVFKAFFEKDRLSHYDPTKASLPTFVRFVTRNLVLSQMRVERRAPLPMDLIDEGSTIPAELIHQALESADLRAKLVARLRQELSEEELDLFLRVCGDPPQVIQVIAEELKVTLAVIYKRKERLLLKVRETMQGLLEDKKVEVPGPAGALRGVKRVGRLGG